MTNTMASIGKAGLMACMPLTVGAALSYCCYIAATEPGHSMFLYLPIMALGTLHGALTCNALSVFISFLIFCTGSVFACCGYQLPLSWAAWIGGAFCVLSVVTTAIITYCVFTETTADFSISNPESPADCTLDESQASLESQRDIANPRCKTCHAKAACPYKPGALLDRYKSATNNEITVNSANATDAL